VFRVTDQFLQPVQFGDEVVHPVDILIFAADLGAKWCLPSIHVSGADAAGSPTTPMRADAHHGSPVDLVTRLRRQSPRAPDRHTNAIQARRIAADRSICAARRPPQLHVPGVERAEHERWSTVARAKPRSVRRPVEDSVGKHRDATASARRTPAAEMSRPYEIGK
jgi:hypothetical protein